MTKLTQQQITTRYLKKLKCLIFALLTCHILPVSAETVKPTWYRYYDSKGIANLSTTVSPNHIRYGYQALDANMQVMQRTQPFNPDKASSHVSRINTASKQKEADQRLKKAYGSSHVAIKKRHEALLHIHKQIKLQQQQLQQLQKDRVMFKKQEQQYSKKNLAVPKTLQNTLNYNQQYLQNGQKQLQALQMQYQKTQVEYDRIIQRLKALE